MQKVSVLWVVPWISLLSIPLVLENVDVQARPLWVTGASSWCSLQIFSLE